MNLSPNIQPIVWSGQQEFKIVGTGLHEDTLRVEGSGQKSAEKTSKLILPTLCITYADMRFQNSIGGEQLNYPDSQVYGTKYFDPAVTIKGGAEVERLTYIRGAESVRIDAKETTIEYFPRNTLIVPRLRIAKKEPATARVEIPQTYIFVDQPLTLKIFQYADGRHIGGVALEKRHPDWKPTPEKETYDLLITTIDGKTQKPLCEALINILHWNPKLKTPYGLGGFYLDAQQYTDINGCAKFANRPSGNIEAYTAAYHGYRFTPRCLRPLGGQKVRLHMNGWRLDYDKVDFIWKGGETLESIANLTGHPAGEILKVNNISAEQLTEGKKITLPCYAAEYNLEPWDDLELVAKWFGYKGTKGLLKAKIISNVSEFNGATPLQFPDWRFFFARENDRLASIDALFDLPLGSSTVLGRVFRANVRLPYQAETIAVPTKSFAGLLRKWRLENK
jgi:hypothetical protein